MRAISLWQPWASLWLSPLKVHETRHWSTTYRGWLAVHAAKRLVSDCGEELDELCMQQFGAMWRRTLPRGAILGTVDLVDCLPTEIIVPALADITCGDFSAGRYGWKRNAWRQVPAPVPYIGRQGFFNVPDELLASVALPERTGPSTSTAERSPFSPGAEADAQRSTERS
jgi:activating signal cointegrator 1